LASALPTPLRVKHLMIDNLVTVNADDSVMEAARLMSEKGISSLVVSHEKEF
jgi:CBS domain-containing protein